MDDLEAIRQKRLAELQQQQQQQQSSPQNDAQAAYQQEQAQAERDAQVQAVLRQVMTPEARERLTRIEAISQGIG